MKRRSQVDSSLKFPKTARLETRSLTSYSSDTHRDTTAQPFCYSCFYQLPNTKCISKCPREAWINSKSVQRWQKWNRFDTHSAGPNDGQRNTATQEPTPRHHYSLYVFPNERQLQARQSNKFFKKLRNSQLFRCKLNTASFRRRGTLGISTDLCAPWAAQFCIISQLASQQIREPTMLQVPPKQTAPTYWRNEKFHSWNSYAWRVPSGLPIPPNL